MYISHHFLESADSMHWTLLGGLVVLELMRSLNSAPFVLILLKFAWVDISFYSLGVKHCLSKDTYPLIEERM